MSGWLVKSTGYTGTDDLLPTEEEINEWTRWSRKEFVVPSEDNPFEFRAPIVGGNNTSMAENYYLFFKPLPVGDHTIELQYTRKPPGQPQAFEEGLC